MAESFTPNPVTNLANFPTAGSTLDANFSTIGSLFTDVLSRSGTAPNQMLTSLDMNGNQIINLGPPTTATSAARLQDIPSVMLQGGNINITNNGTYSVFDTRATASATSIPSNVNFIMTGGYTQANGTGAAAYFKSLTLTLGGFQSADGAFWALAEFVVNPQMFGALGDGKANDYSAIQNAVNFAATFSPTGFPSSVVFPPGNYFVRSTIVVPSGVWLIGTGGPFLQPTITSNGANIIVIQLNGGGSSMRNLQVLGGQLGSTLPTVFLPPTSVESVIEDCRIFYGYNAIQINGADFTIDNCHIESAYGNSVVWIFNQTTGGAGGYFKRTKIDQNFPSVVPAGGSFNPVAWAPNTNYAAGQIVTNGGFYMQCTVGGISGVGPPPFLQNYGVNILDNKAIWQLLSPSTYYGILADNGCNVLFVEQGDFTGPYVAGISLSNTVGGPTFFGISANVTTSTFGNNYQANIQASAGFNLVVQGNNLGGTLFPQSPAVYTFGSFTGDVAISDNVIIGSPYGVFIGAGANYNVSNNLIYSASIAAVFVAAGINQFVITGNVLSTSASGFKANGIGVQVQVGPSNFYNITNNLVHGCTTGISDAGTGTAKLIAGNF